MHKNKCDHIKTYMYMFVIVELPYGTWGRKERKRECERVNNMVIHNFCEGGGYKDVY
jgi:hypothetical protein